MSNLARDFSYDATRPFLPSFRPSWVRFARVLGGLDTSTTGGCGCDVALERSRAERGAFGAVRTESVNIRLARPDPVRHAPSRTAIAWHQRNGVSRFEEALGLRDTRERTTAARQRQDES